MTINFKQILISIPVCILVTDLKGKIVLINEAATRQLGLEGHRKTGDHISHISKSLKMFVPL
jgi:PAS domain S-box-containing protein